MTTKSRTLDPSPSFYGTYSGWGLTPPEYTMPTDSELQAKLDALTLESAPPVPGTEEITYDSGQSQFNFCDHTRDVFNYKNTQPVSFFYYNGGSPSMVNVKGSAIIPSVDPFDSVDLLITDQMRKRAWGSLMPELNTGFSLLNFIWELKDVRLLLSLAAKLSYLARTFDKALLSSRTAAELTLSYSFAIAPFIRDVETMVDGLFRVNKRINEFIAQGRKVNTYHYVEDQQAAVRTVEDATRPGCILYSDKVQTYRATLKASYTYKKPPELEGLLRVTGLRLTPEAIWNAIPFTFLIDWVLSVSTSLRSLDRDTNLTVHLVDYCDSIKYRQRFYTERTYDMYYVGHQMSSVYVGQGSTEPPVIWEHERSRYLRVPGVPDTGYAFPVLDTLSNRELVLGGALLRTLK